MLTLNISINYRKVTFALEDIAYENKKSSFLSHIDDIIALPRFFGYL